MQRRKQTLVFAGYFQFGSAAVKQGPDQLGRGKRN
jgi:hypothetical protein